MRVIVLGLGQCFEGRKGCPSYGGNAACDVLMLEVESILSGALVTKEIRRGKIQASGGTIHSHNDSIIILKVMEKDSGEPARTGKAFSSSTEQQAIVAALHILWYGPYQKLKWISSEHVFVSRMERQAIYMSCGIILYQQSLL